MVGTANILFAGERQGSTPDIQTKTLQLRVRNETDVDAATSLLLSETPAVFGLKTRQGFDIQQQSDKSWLGTVEYSTLAETDIGDVILSGSTSGNESITKLHANEHVADFDINAVYAGENYNGALGIDLESKEVKGVDIQVPKFDIGIKTIYSPGTISFPWLLSLYTKSYTTNATVWNGFPIGSVLFRGVEFEQNNKEKDVVTFQISIQPPLVDVHFPTTGGVIPPDTGPGSGINKRGWDYLWFEYAKSKGTNIVRPQLVAVHVDRVYPESIFNF